MCDAGDHHIALPNYPLVPPDNGTAGRHVFKRWIGGAVIARSVHVPVEKGQHQNGHDVRIGKIGQLFDVSGHIVCNGVYRPFVGR